MLIKVYNHSVIIYKEENEMAKDTIPEDAYVVEEPDWGVLMFWEDLSYFFRLVGDFFKKLFGLA